MTRIAMWSTGLAVLLFWAATAGAATITVYTDKTQWENALGGQFLTEDFADAQLNTGVSFVSSESGHINPAQECYQDVLASTSQNDPMTTWSFGPQIYGYGGDWTLGGPGGSGNSLLVYIADSELYVGAISNSYNGGFWGFASDTAFTSVKLVGGAGSNQQNYSLDDMVYSFVLAPGDANGDGKVDGSDLSVWQLNYDPLGTGNNTFETGDFNGDGRVDGGDLAIWQQNYNPLGITAQVAATNVPEPATLLLMGASALGLVGIRRQRKKW